MVDAHYLTDMEVSSSPAIPPASPDSKAAHCPVCETPQATQQARYCAYCGQRHRYDRLTVGSVFRDFFQQVTNFDRGFGRNLRLIFWAPGRMFHDLIQRHNGRYQNIIRFTLIVTTLSVLVYQVFGIYEAQFAGMEAAMRPPESTGEDKLDIGLMLRDVLNRYMSIFYFLTIPFVALINRVLYWKQPYNLAEHFVLAAIQATGSILIVLFFDILNFGLLGGQGWLVAFGYSAYYVYVAWCLRRALGSSWWAALWKAAVGLFAAMTGTLICLVVLIPLFFFAYEYWYGAEALQALLDHYR